MVSPSDAVATMIEHSLVSAAGGARCRECKRGVCVWERCREERSGEWSEWGGDSGELCAGQPSPSLNTAAGECCSMTALGRAGRAQAFQPREQGYATFGVSGHWRGLCRWAAEFRQSDIAAGQPQRGSNQPRRKPA